MLTAFLPPVAGGLRLRPLSLSRHPARAPSAHRFVSARSVPHAAMRTGILVSGGGRSLENICARVAAGKLVGIDVSVVVASKMTAGALDKAARFSVPTRVVRPRDFADSDSFSDAVSAVMDEFRIDLVVLAGWLHFYRIPERYAQKVINIHPSLIPAFCGKGYFGHHVHQAVVRAVAPASGLSSL
jgi:phosphoribosylglycinamide formyltransferase 1